jgi:hypothetical protein
MRWEVRRMAFSGMLRHAALVGTDVSEEFSAFFIRVTRIGELGTTLMKEAPSSFETSVLTRATWRNIPENLKSYTWEVCSGIQNEFIHVGFLQHNVTLHSYSSFLCNDVRQAIWNWEHIKKDHPTMYITMLMHIYHIGQGWCWQQRASELQVDLP